MKKVLGLLVILILMSVASCAAVNKTGNTENDPLSEYNDIVKKSEKSIDFPIYGDYLEKTDEIVRQYYCNNALFAAVALKNEALAQVFGKYNPLGNKICLDVTNRCMKQYPDYEIVGYVYAREGYSAIYPLVFNKDEKKIQYYENELCDFRMTDSFGTVEEGRKAFADYFEMQRQIRLGIPVFPWETADDNYNYSFINKYLHQDMWQDTTLLDKLPDTEFAVQYDSYIALPLLDKDMEEGKYVGYLLYWKNKLIAELVLKVDDETYSGVFLSCSSYDIDKKAFEPVAQSEYLTSIQSSGKSPSYVIWNNGSYLIP